MTKSKKELKPSVDAAWIGTFKLSVDSRAVLEIYLDAKAIERIENIVAEHRDLIQPHLVGRPTSAAIATKLFEVQSKAKELRSLLRGLDTCTNAQLNGVVAKSRIENKVHLDLTKMADDLDSLDVLAGHAARHTPTNAGAGVRGVGQRVAPNTVLVGEIARVIAPFGIRINTYSPQGKFTKICQAICDSGGFDKDTFNIEGSVKAYVAATK